MKPLRKRGERARNLGQLYDSHRHALSVPAGEVGRIVDIKRHGGHTFVVKVRFMVGWPEQRRVDCWVNERAVEVVCL